MNECVMIYSLIRYTIVLIREREEIKKKENSVTLLQFTGRLLPTFGQREASQIVTGEKMKGLDANGSLYYETRLSSYSS